MKSSHSQPSPAPRIDWPTFTAIPPRPQPVAKLLTLLLQLEGDMHMLCANADDYRRLGSDEYPWSQLPAEVQAHIEVARKDAERRGEEWSIEHENDVRQIHHQIAGERQTWQQVRRDSPERFELYSQHLEAAILAVPEVKEYMAQLEPLPAAWCTKVVKALRDLQTHTMRYHRGAWHFPTEESLGQWQRVISAAIDVLTHGVFEPLSKDRDQRHVETAPEPVRLHIDLATNLAWIGKSSFAVRPRAAQLLSKIVGANGHPVSRKKLCLPGKPKERIDRELKKVPSEVRCQIVGQRGLGYWHKVT